MRDNLFKICSLVSILFFFTSCGKSINGSSDEKFYKSLEEISISLNGEKREQFDDAIYTIVNNSTHYKSMLSDEESSEKEAADFKYMLKGKTANQIIKLGNRIYDENEKKKLDDAKWDIDGLYNEIERKESQFEVRSVITGNNINQENLKIIITNNSSIACTTLYVEGEMIRKNRTIPLFEVNYGLSAGEEGMEPGEEFFWTIDPTNDKDWSYDYPNDATLNLRIRNVKDYDRKTHYFDTDYDREELSTLLEKYPQFKREEEKLTKEPTKLENDENSIEKLNQILEKYKDVPKEEYPQFETKED